MQELYLSKRNVKLAGAHEAHQAHKHFTIRCAASLQPS